MIVEVGGLYPASLEASSPSADDEESHPDVGLLGCNVLGNAAAVISHVSDQRTLCIFFLTFLLQATALRLRSNRPRNEIVERNANACVLRGMFIGGRLTS